MEQDKKQYQREEIGEKQKWFQMNHRYTTICIYALMVIVCGTIVAMMIVNWSETKAFIVKWFSVLSPFWAALLIAYFLRPIVDWIDRTLHQLLMHGKYRKMVRYFSIFLAYVFVIGCIILVITFIIPQLTHSISELTASVPVIYDRLSKYLMGLQERYPDLDMTALIQKLQNMVPDLVNFGTNIVGNGLVMIYSLSISVARMVINVLLAIMISIYMIASEDFFREQAKRLVYAIFNERKGDAVCSTCKECNAIFSAFLLSKALDSLIIGCLCCMIMSIIGLPYAVLLSVIVGITNMIPYFGPFIGAVPGILIYICLKPMNAIIFAIMILVLQQFDGLVLGPRLLGQSTGLNPIWVIFAITVGGAYFGVIGMFIGVPVVAVFAYLLNKLIKYRLKNRNVKALREFEKKN
ncbi:MAG: AI-2E family transporter [Lachnospiraceae bacterium]|nr:AI-2E family transporter [Lachnospiraceae bacterium]